MDLSKFMNLTPHAICVQTPAGMVEIPASGLQCRVEALDRPGEDIEGVPSVTRRLGEVIVPPEATAFANDGGWLIVSGIALEAIRDQRMVLSYRAVAPDTGPTAIRAAGRIVAVTRFVRA